MNPFDMRGPEFLALYIAVLVVAVVAALLLRWLLCVPGDEPPVEAFDLTPYEIVYLAGRERLAVDAAIVRLVHRRALSLGSTNGRLAQRDPLASGALPLEKVVYAAAGAEPGKHINEVHTAAQSAAGKLRERLDSLGLLLADKDAWRARLASAGMLALVAMIGLIKVFVGLSRHRPVAFLIVLLIVTAAIALALLIKRPVRSRRGDELLKRMRQDNAALQTAAARRVEHLSDADLLVAMGLFGTAALAGSALAQAHASLMAARMREASAWSHGGTWASSCGSACGGGGGGGGCGGGCGGGGCGGCGGGG